MKDQHLKFLLKFHKPTSRHLYTLRYGRVEKNGALKGEDRGWNDSNGCLLYTSPSPRDQRGSRMPSSA